MRDLISKRKSLFLVDLCGGTGLGGAALARILSERGIEARLLVVDLREDALSRVGEWGVEAEVVVHDALELHELGVKADIVLMYGHSAPHFDPWDIVRLLASVAQSVKDDGIFVAEEVRRIPSQGLQGAAGRAGGDALVVSVHGSYDPVRGTVRRICVDLVGGSRAELEAFLWGLAELAAFAWAFFEDVDLLNLDSRGTRCFILARHPRKKLRRDTT